MDSKNRSRRRTTSCGGLPWRVHEGRPHVLLIKQFTYTDSWGIPKGHIKDGETLEQCALREIREETGLDVELGERLPDVTSVYRDEEKTVCTWLAQPTGDHTPHVGHPDCEVADAFWFPIDELPVIHLYQRDLVKRAIDMILAMLP